MEPAGTVQRGQPQGQELSVSGGRQQGAVSVVAAGGGVVAIVADCGQ